MKRIWIILLLAAAALAITAIVFVLHRNRRQLYEPMDGPGMVYEVVVDEIEYTETNRKTGGTYRLFAEKTAAGVHITSERTLEPDAAPTVLEADADAELFDRIGDLFLQAGLEQAGKNPEPEPRRFQPVEKQMSVKEPYYAFTVTSFMDLSEPQENAWREAVSLLEETLREPVYPVEYWTDPSYLQNAKEAYPAGANVVVYYDLIATDTDYTFLLDGEPIGYDYDEKRGFVISFVMPPHAVKLEQEMKNTMMYDPDAEGPDSQGGDIPMEKALVMLIGDREVSVEWEDNDSVAALRELAENGAIVIEMSMYGGFEQVGSIGTDLVREDRQTTTQAGDIVLYAGDQLVVFYGSNSWAYTRLGRITDQTPEQLRDLLGNGDVTISLLLKEQSGAFTSLR